MTERRGAGRRFKEEFGAYLYDSLGVNHPVLEDVAAVGEQLRTERRRIDRTLVHL